MKIEGFVWLEDIIEKLAWKHQVTADEVEEVFDNNPHFRFIAKGRKRRDENLYAAYGRTDAGRYLTLFFIHKPGRLALIISARDMDRKERKRYG